MKVLVLGDIITDKYIYGSSSRISPEAPVPVVNITNVATSLGGAGLVFENLKSLGVDVTLFDTMQPRSTKTRIISDGHYITRLDEDEQADGEVVLKKVIDRPDEKCHKLNTKQGYFLDLGQQFFSITFLQHERNIPFQ